MNHNALDYQATLVGNEKNTLLFETNPNTLSEILIKQKCKVTKIVINQNEKTRMRDQKNALILEDENNPLEDLVGSEKFDVIVLGDFLQCIKHPVVFLKKLKDFLNTNGYLVLSITNIGHAYNRIKLLNGEFVYTEDGLINGNFLRFFTFETTLHLISDANYSITKLYREKEDLDLVHRKDLKYFTIPDELIKSIKNDPESLVSKYVFSINPMSTGSSEIDYLKDFPKSLTTERLKEFFRYYQGDIAESYDRIIDEKNTVIEELEKSIDERKGTVKELDKLSPETERYNRERIKVMSETEQYNKDRISVQKTMIKGLEQSLETERYNRDRLRIQFEMIKGLEQSKRENQEMIKGLEQSKHESLEMIKGLEESLKETEQYLKKTVEEYEKTIDDIYNSTTWKIASKFTGGQTKRKKN
jgi:hypothetical protein